MKKVITLIFILCLAVAAMAQQKPPYFPTETKQVVGQYSGYFSKSFTMPGGSASPSFPAWVPDSLKRGSLYYRTSDTTLRAYNPLTLRWDAILTQPNANNTYLNLSGSNAKQSINIGIFDFTASHLTANSEIYTPTIGYNSGTRGFMTFGNGSGAPQISIDGNTGGRLFEFKAGGVVKSYFDPAGVLVTPNIYAGGGFISGELHVYGSTGGAGKVTFDNTDVSKVWGLHNQEISYNVDANNANIRYLKFNQVTDRLTFGVTSLPNTIAYTGDISTATQNYNKRLDTIKNNSAYDLTYRVPVDTTQIAYFNGDSYIAGSGASVAAKRAANIVANTIGVPSFINQGSGGSGIINALWRSYSLDLPINNLRTNIIMSGLTDVGHIAPDKRVFSMLYNGYTAFIANKFLKTAIPASDASITYSGTWSSAPADSLGGKATYIGGTARQTLTSGATATVTTTGNNAIIATFSADSTKIKLDNFSVTVDGNLAGTYSFDNQVKYFQPLNGGVPVFGLLNYFAHSSVVFLNNLGPGTHTIVITKGSNTSRKLILDYVGTLNNPKNTGPLIIGEIVHLTDSAIRTYKNEYGAILTNATIDSANVAVKSSLKAFQGYPVTIARTNHYFDYRTEVIAADLLHPDDLGHLHLAQAFLGAMALPNYRSGYVGDGLAIAGGAVVNAITQAGGYTKALSGAQGAAPGIYITQSGTSPIANLVLSTINTSVGTGGGVTGPSIIVGRYGTSVSTMTALPIYMFTGSRSSGGTGTDLRGIYLNMIGSTASSSTASNIRNNSFSVSLYNTTAIGEGGTDIAGLFRVNGMSSKPATALRVVARGGSTNYALSVDSGVVHFDALTVSTSLQLDANKNAISVANTGTGNNVLATSPTLVTPSLGTPTSLVLTNATGLLTAGIVNNAVTYGKMQLGTTNKLFGTGSGTSFGEITLGNNFSFASSTLNFGLTGTAILDFPSTAAQSSEELTITVTGAVDGDLVLVSPPSASANTGCAYTARVSAANTVSVKHNNYSSVPVDPVIGTFKVLVVK